MFKGKSKKVFFVLIATLSLTFLQNTHAKLSPASKNAVQIVRILTALTKFVFAMAANVQALNENELAVLKLETAYLCLDVADTALKLIDDYKNVSLLEGGVEIYHLIKIFKNIKELKNKKPVALTNINANDKTDVKRKEFSKKIFYSILKYIALANNITSSFLFDSSEEAEKIFASNMCGFTQLLFDLIDIQKPEMRSKIVLALSPLLLITSFVNSAFLWEERENDRWQEEWQKRLEQQRKREEAQKFCQYFYGHLEQEQEETLNPIISKIQTGKESCSICLCPFEKNEIIGILNCQGKHLYHKDCIQNWFNQEGSKSSCPLCRQEAVKILKEILKK
jgi:hypothetical protein